MEISKGRQVSVNINCLDEIMTITLKVCTAENLDKWFDDIDQLINCNPELSPCMKDPTRIFNQDETAVEVGSESQKVLAEKGSKVLYHVSGGSREHITVSYMCSASGGLIPPRVIYRGVRNVAVDKMKDLPRDGRSGEWQFSVSDKGYITQDLFVEVLKDLDKYLVANNIERPVILIIDGAKAHISLQAANFCLAKKIQPILLKPNMTHMIQPLDLTFFCSLKRQVKRLAWDWQCNPLNAGQFLTKYSVMFILHKATEICLDNEELISNGFKRSGLFPFNRYAPNRDKLLPSTIFESTVPECSSNTDQMHEVNHNEEEVKSVSDRQLFGSSLEFSPGNADLECFEASEIQDEEIAATSNQSIITSSNQEVAESVVLDEIGFSDQDRTDCQTVDTNLTKTSSSSMTEIVNPEQTDSVNSYHIRSTPHVNNATSGDISKRVLSSIVAVSDSVAQTEVSIPARLQSIQSLKSVSQLSVDEWIVQLHKFEVVMLTPNQVQEFNAAFEAKTLEHESPLFKSWLPLKMATIPTEDESIKRILSSHTFSNVPKRQNKRQDNLPTGKDRFNPISPAWINTLENQENKKRRSEPVKAKVNKAQPKKTANKTKKNVKK